MSQRRRQIAPLLRHAVEGKESGFTVIR